MIETSTGIGFLLGPLWGSLMYQWGGYPAPFGFCALVYLLLWPCVTYNLYQSKWMREENKAREKEILAQRAAVV